MRFLQSPINLSLRDSSLRLVVLLIFCRSAIRSLMRIFSSISNRFRLLFVYVSYGERFFLTVRRLRFLSGLGSLAGTTGVMYNFELRVLSPCVLFFFLGLKAKLLRPLGGANDI